MWYMCMMMQDDGRRWKEPLGRICWVLDIEDDGRRIMGERWVLKVVGDAEWKKSTL